MNRYKLHIPKPKTIWVEKGQIWKVVKEPIDWNDHLKKPIKIQRGEMIQIGDQLKSDVSAGFEVEGRGWYFRLHRKGETSIYSLCSEDELLNYCELNESIQTEP